MTNDITPITFEEHPIDLIDHDGQTWISSVQISQALGFNKKDAVSQIYSRNKDEFEDYTCTLNLSVNGKLCRTRVFNPMGARLVGMLARTDNAKAFRKWVLEVLERVDQERHNKQILALPETASFNDVDREKLIKMAENFPKLANFIKSVSAIDFQRKHAEWLVNFLMMQAEEICDNITDDVQAVAFPELAQALQMIQQRVQQGG